MSRRLDWFLSGKIQSVLPDGLVYCSNNGEKESWTMERVGQEPLGLGENFRDAKMAVLAMVRAYTVSKGKEIKESKEGEKP